MTICPPASAPLLFAKLAWNGMTEFQVRVIMEQRVELWVRKKREQRQARQQWGADHRREPHPDHPAPDRPPIYQDTRIDRRKSPEIRAARSAAMKAYWNNPINLRARRELRIKKKEHIA